MGLRPFNVAAPFQVSRAAPVSRYAVSRAAPFLATLFLVSRFKGCARLMFLGFYGYAVSGAAPV